MTATDVRTELERLLRFARHHGLLEELDVIPARNALMELFEIAEPKAVEEVGPIPETPSDILEHLLDYAAEKGILKENNSTWRDLLDARIMGVLMPRQSEVARRFRETAETVSIQKATDHFYRLSQASNYIRMDRIRKNEYWLAPTEYGDLEISINLSKPEKDPKEIAALKKAPKTEYPRCLICLENVGYPGRINHPARQNLRVIPLKLNGENWYFQYSPYVYYPEHCIVFSEGHTPMKICGETFDRLLDFLDRIPHYFIGSNADLPIVGGSILNHDHFQGGRHIFPMERAPVEKRYIHPEYGQVRAGRVKWPMSVIRLNARDRDRLAALARHILEAWRSYSDPEADVQAFSTGNGENIPHNTITPIARKTASGEYEMDLVLRNNRTTPEHPEGLFHPHRELHHIKKENIGLIEVMGLAILPGRLKQELDEIAGILISENRATRISEIGVDDHHPLCKHADWMRELAAKHERFADRAQALQVLRREAGNKFARVLTDAGVFKRTEKGMAAFDRWMKEAGFADGS